MAKAQAITQLPERQSALSGLVEISAWLKINVWPMTVFEDALYASPAKKFRIRFTSDLGLIIRGKRTAIHVWNSATPKLADNLVRMALALAKSAYVETGQSVDDLGVLDLKRKKLVLLSEATLAPTSGLPLAERVDRLIETVEAEVDRERDDDTERPISPPPP